MKIAYLASDIKPNASWIKGLKADYIKWEELVEIYSHNRCYDLIIADIYPDCCFYIEELCRIKNLYPDLILVLIIKKSFTITDLWIRVLSKADFIFGNSYRLSKRIELQSGFKVTEFFIPEDISSEDRFIKSSRSDKLLIVTRKSYSLLDFIKEIGIVAGLVALAIYKLRIIDFQNSAKAYKEIESSKIVYLPESLDDEGTLVKCCSNAGAIVISTIDYNPAKICYPYTVFHKKHKRQGLLFLWIFTSKTFSDFFRENAKCSNINLSIENRAYNFWEKLRYKISIPEFEYRNSLMSQIHYYSGDGNMQWRDDECGLVCLLRNGSEYIETFLMHYRQMGIAHFIFIDNGSDDDTLDLLRGEKDVTIYQTSLPHKFYENDIRRLVIEKHSKNRWCLNVDIDELFDYPDSDKISLKELLRYLSVNQYTSMAGYMLDMFNKEVIFNNIEKINLKESYRFYDISNIEKKDYYAPDVIAYCNYNRLSSNDIKCYFGGIRKTLFASNIAGHYLLTKHPLIYLDGELEPVTNPHYCNKSKVADVSCVLYHYKFTPSFKDKVLESRKTNRYIKFAQRQYDQYFKKIANGNSLIIDTAGTKELFSVNDLVMNGFLQVSPTFINYVKAVCHKQQLIP
ncbi:glycosyltransferase family 2 protein [Sporocytophaga myxococcoides]|uniref:glycosyltransferase family 2 protein n=1 Tax=Sporocytophaga myxococcoides TaxID=153721 RepID=UPI00041FD83C|nr:glycosyltransferase family 2 protein [Sporocytophaga myxococcoides]